MIRLATGACVLVALLLAARSAPACSCPAQYITTVLPAAGATDVPTDGTIVVLSSASEATRVRLVDAAEAAVPLTHVRTLEASPGCGTGLQDVLFFRPGAPLAPRSSYVLDIGFSPLANGQSDTPTRVAFTTGTGPRVATAAGPLQTELHALKLTDGTRALQLYARADGPAPSFIAAKGNPATVVLGLGPLALQTRTHLALGVIDCAAYEHVDVTGETIGGGRLCEPTKCSSGSTFICSSCGQNCGWQLSENAWTGAPACNATAPPTPDGGGCSVATRPTSAFVPAMLLLLACWGRRRRR